VLRIFCTIPHTVNCRQRSSTPCSRPNWSCEPTFNINPWEAQTPTTSHQYKAVQSSLRRLGLCIWYSEEEHPAQSVPHCTNQSRQWVDGSWVKWVTSWDGSHGPWVGVCWPMTQYLINPVSQSETYLRKKIVSYWVMGQHATSSAECERHFSAFNARHTITFTVPLQCL